MVVSTLVWPSSSCTRREHELPAPLAWRTRILARQCIGQLHVPVSLRYIPLMEFPHAFEMRFERPSERLRKHRQPILAAFPVPHQHLAIFEVDVLYAQLEAFAKAQPRAIQQARHEPFRALHGVEQALRFAKLPPN